MLLFDTIVAAETWVFSFQHMVGFNGARAFEENFVFDDVSCWLTSESIAPSEWFCSCGATVLH